MIATESIFLSLERQIKKVLPDIIVTPNFLDSSEFDYVWVRLRESRNDIGQGYIERNISVDLQVVLQPEQNLAVLNSKLYTIADDFCTVFNEFLQVGDRFITLYNSSSHIFDSILTYSFNLQFADGVERKFHDEETFELMQTLKIKKV